MRHPGAEDAAAGNAFWRFSLAFYARPGVAEALLALQDRAGRDVNLMLYALWLGTYRVRLHKEEFLAAQDLIAPLDDTIAVLRRQRRALRDNPNPDMAALRRRVLRLELEAERLLQYRLAARLRTGVLGTGTIGTTSDRLATAATNLALYLGADAGAAEAGVLLAALAELTRRR